MSTSFRASLAAAILLGSMPVSAHHSPAMFDLQNTIQLQGTVRQFQWTNPHSYIQLLVKNSKGKEDEWSLEMGAPIYLYNLGWRPSTLKAGDSVSVKVAPLRKGGHGGLVVDATMSDGRKLGGGKR